MTRILQGFVYSLTGSALVAIAFLVTYYYTLPRDDLARQQPVAFFVLDPFVLYTASPAVLFGAAAATIATIGVPTEKLARMAIETTIITMLTVVAMTPKFGLGAILIGYGVVVLSAAVSRVFRTFD